MRFSEEWLCRSDTTWVTACHSVTNDGRAIRSQILGKIGQEPTGPLVVLLVIIVIVPPVLAGRSLLGSGSSVVLAVTTYAPRTVS